MSGLALMGDRTMGQVSRQIHSKIKSRGIWRVWVWEPWEAGMGRPKAMLGASGCFMVHHSAVVAGSQKEDRQCFGVGTLVLRFLSSWLFFTAVPGSCAAPKPSRAVRWPPASTLFLGNERKAVAVRD